MQRRKKKIKYRKFVSMTDDEVRQIVTDIFHPKKITCIKLFFFNDTATTEIYTEQNDEDAKNGKGLITDMLTLRDPFEWEGSSISTDFQKRGEDFVKLKQFCLAKGMFRYLKDNPYLTEEDV